MAISRNTSILTSSNRRTRLFPSPILLYSTTLLSLTMSSPLISPSPTMTAVTLPAATMSSLRSTTSALLSISRLRISDSILFEEAPSLLVSSRGIPRFQSLRSMRFSLAVHRRIRSTSTNLISTTIRPGLSIRLLRLISHTRLLQSPSQLTPAAY
ncbi:hypothetical protein LINPERHAP1_LOCUS37866 [Linum perenne]